jgi:ATP-binding cassette, subfamily B (MDR/TAP), member 9
MALVQGYNVQYIVYIPHVLIQCALAVRSTPSEDCRFQYAGLGDSLLDVTACSIVYTCILGISILWSRYGSVEPGGVKQKRLIGWSTDAYRAALLVKSVLVAVLSGDDDAWPGTGCHSGTAFIYIAILVSVVALEIQSRACIDCVDAALEGRRDEGLSEPLVPCEEDGKGTVQDEDVRHATIMALLGFAAPDTILLTFGFLFGSLAALGMALIPYYTGKVIDYASIDPDRYLFTHTIWKLLFVALLCAFFTGIRGGLFTYATTRLTVRIRTKLFHSLLSQDIGFFDTNRTGDITSRLAADTTTVTDQICLNLNVMMRSITQAAMVLVFMFKTNWRLTVVTFIMVPIVIVVSKIYGSYYRNLSKKVQSRLAEANSVADECLSGITVLKSHAAEGSACAAYESKLKEFYNIQVKQAIMYALYMVINTFLSAAVVAGALFYGGTLVLNNLMSAGSLVSFMLYQQSLTAAFQSLGDVFSALSAAVGAADKVIELINRQPAFEETGTEQPGQELLGSIELRNITFSYPARPNIRILENFSLLIHPGEVVALVGPSGGGKSSIVKLLERQYLPTTGSILIDGRDIGMYDKQWLRRRVGLVGQEPILFARSIKRNIIYGMELEDGLSADSIPTQEQIEEAAKLANAHDFISNLPEGYDTECGERGVQLSGGQKQRLAIARALVRKPSILLLDEATSALDADSEHVVQEALEHCMVGRTVLVIAHRLSTIQNADRICVVRKGAIVEMGTHDELLQKEGTYEKLVKRQLTMNRSESTSTIGPSNSSTNLAGK